MVYDRPIQLPAATTMKLAVDGVAVQPADFSFDLNTGEILFAAGHAPPNGHPVTAGFEFDVPVRFDIDHLSLSLTAFKAGQIPTIPLVEVLL